MRYQRLDNLEAGWKWHYISKKLMLNNPVTRWIDASEIEASASALKSIEYEPLLIDEWIEKHLSADYIIKLNQAIRAKRKRYFNSEKKETKKKSIDLDYEVWKKLSGYSTDMGCTLSDAIEYLLSENNESQSQEDKENMAA